MTQARHPTARHWTLPAASRAALPAPLERVSLRDLGARPDRFEHHLTVVARVGCAQLEIAAASEPLYFAHHNISDEYALALPTGDALVEAFPMLTLLTSPQSGEDVARIRHRVGDLVLHPFGLLHWPGRLRPPYAPMQFASGERRSGLSLVYCASRPTAPHAERPDIVTPGREGDVKRYVDDIDVPFVLADMRKESARVVAVVGDTTMELLVAPATIAPPRGGYVVVLDTSPANAAGAYDDGDLVYVPEGARMEAIGIARALLVTSEHSAPEVPPETWAHAPGAPFAPFEDGAPGSLPARAGDLELARASSPDGDGVVRARLGAVERDVPRYWLARMLFRIALHRYAIGYVETYGGFFYDDRGGVHRLGLRGAGVDVVIDRHDIATVIELLYRAVAPDGYAERLV